VRAKRGAFQVGRKTGDKFVSELWVRSAGELAAGIARKPFSSAEVVDPHLRPIEAINSRANAVVRVLADETRRAAAEADPKGRRWRTLAPLNGFYLRSRRTSTSPAATWGAMPLAEGVVTEDAPKVERMRAAGAIPLGPTNLSDMSLRARTRATRGPWPLGPPAAPPRTKNVCKYGASSS